MADQIRDYSKIVSEALNGDFAVLTFESYLANRTIFSELESGTELYDNVVSEAVDVVVDCRNIIRSFDRAVAAARRLPTRDETRVRSRSLALTALTLVRDAVESPIAGEPEVLRQLQCLFLEALRG
jgi:hypothetical protein